MDELGLAEGTIITENYSGKEERNGKKIKFIPLLEWIMNEEKP